MRERTWLSLVGIGIALAAGTAGTGAWATEKAASEWVRLGPDGKLVYKTTPAGDRIMDFSYAGYMGGGVALPEVAVKITVRPVEGDNTAAIQEAIDKISAMSLEKGFRGAVLLAPGEYTCSGTISVRTPGIVLRGSGSGANGSIIKMVGGRHVAIVIGLPSGQRESEATGQEPKSVQTIIADAYVPSGTTTFTVADASGFTGGDTISIRRPITPAWVHFMQMDNLVRDGRPQTWLSSGRNDSMERTITAMVGNKITVDIPLSDSFDAKYLNSPGSTVTKVRLPMRITQVGVEHLHIQCPPLEVAYSQAPYSAIWVGGDDCWVRDVFCEETMNSTTLAGKRITMQQVVVQHTFANLGASKPTDFSIEDSQDLLDRCRIAGGNIYFVWTGSPEPGPNVLLNCTFTGKGSRVQPHMRWSTGMLVDNCHVPEGSIDFTNRGVMGSGHGWTMGWAVAWNCTAKGYYIQNPPGAVNWAIGCIGASVLAPRPFDKSPNLPEGIFDSPGKPVTPQSLYLTQLAERLGPQAIRNIGYSLGEWRAEDESSSIRDPKSAIRNSSPSVLQDLAEHRPVNASNMRGGTRVFGGEKALDGDPNTYWTTDDGVTRASLEVDLEGPEEINAIEIQEAAGLGSRVQEYKVEGQVGSDWKLLSQGTIIGDRKLDHFPPVTVWKVRLTILRASASPAICTFSLYLDKASS